MSAETSSTVPTVQLEPTADFTGLDLPAYAQPGDAGADLRTTVHVILHPGERAIVPTGLKIALPAGFVGLIHPRSGLAAKHGLTVVNSPGTIDAGYRGELMVILLNTDKKNSIELGRGDRIAQLVIQRVETAHFEVVDTLDETVRGEGGLGSTGGYSLPAAAADPVAAPCPEDAPFAELPVRSQAQRLVEGFGDTGFLGDRTRQILEDALTLALTGYDPATVREELSRDNCREDLLDVTYQWLSLTQAIAPAQAPLALTPLDAIRTVQASPAAAAAFSRLYPAGADADLYTAAINRVSAALDNDTIRATIFQVAGASVWPTAAAPTA